MSADSLFILYQNWEVLPLGDVCRLGGGNVQTGPFGSQLHASDYVLQGVPSVMPQNIGDNRIVEEKIARVAPDDVKRLSKYKIREGDIVYSRRGDVERRALVRKSEDGWLCGTGCLRIRFGDGIVYPIYAAHYLGHPRVREWIVRHAHGATMPNLNTTILSELPFVLPSWNEQVLIGDFIEKLDDKITLNRQINQTLEAMAQAIFKSWFVDFDPVKAKIAAIEAGQDPLRAAMSAISGKRDAELDVMPRPQYDELSATAALFPEELVESELGDVPKGWKAQKIGDFIERISVGKKFNQKSALPEGGVPILDQGKSGVIGFHNEKPSVFASLNKPVVVFANHTCYMRLITFDFSAIQNVLPFIGGTVDTIWAYYATKDKVKFSEYKGHWPDFVLIETVVPTRDLTIHFRKIIEPLVFQMRSLEQQSEQLAVLRDTLLPKLLSGELSVADLGEVV